MEIKNKMLPIISMLSKIILSFRGHVKLGSDKDFFVFSGLFILSYGLYLLTPWLGFAAGGLILMIFGLLMKDNS